MKKLITLTTIFLLSFTPHEEKKYNIELNNNQIQMLWSALQFAKDNLQTSQAPAVDVKNITTMIDSLQSLIKIQFNAQQESDKTEKKK